MAKINVSRTANRERARKALERLRKAYPGARCTLDHKDPLQLLVATILAAQCTDERVNIVTKGLFKKYKKPADYLEVPQEELEGDVRTCGFYRQKAKSIRNACATLIERFGGKVPGAMDELLQLDGVGRKTANVILVECFDTPGIIVDTHCKRLAGRLGFSKHDDPAKIEQDLMNIVPQQDWGIFSHALVFHGRTICLARKPKCPECPLNDLCPYPDKTKS